MKPFRQWSWVSRPNDNPPAKIRRCQKLGIGDNFRWGFRRSTHLPDIGKSAIVSVDSHYRNHEEGVYLVSVANSGYYDLSYELSSAAAGATVYFYDATKDRSIISTVFDFFDTVGEMFVGVLTNPLLEDHLYAVILTTRQYMADDYEPLVYELELSATPADRLPHSD